MLMLKEGRYRTLYLWNTKTGSSTEADSRIVQQIRLATVVVL
jgi:hypothetical protein